MNYWVYENIPRQKTRVHLGSCSFCKEGHGLHGVGQTETGAWLGPFATIDEAERVALSRGRVDNRRCLECLPSLGNERRDVTVLPTAQSKGTSGPWQWDTEEELFCSLVLRWKPLGRVTLDPKGKLNFPPIDPIPGLYRLRLRTVEGGASTYVGESDNIQRRFRNYRNPGPTQKTSLRINSVLRENLAAGGQISVAIAQEVWVDAREGKARADLNRASLRRLFENFALSVEQALEVESLNR